VFLLKFFIAKDLACLNPGASSQILERQGLNLKFLRNKDLAVRPFGVSPERIVHHPTSGLWKSVTDITLADLNCVPAL
jgi:hypothetical protein